MNRRARSTWGPVLCIAVLLLAVPWLGGCGLIASGPGWAVLVLVAAGLLAVGVGCRRSHTLPSSSDASVADVATADSPSTDGPPVGCDDAGCWERCCQEGRLTTCLCPPRATCNYGQGLIDCGDGRCGYAMVTEPFPYPTERARICGTDGGVDGGGDDAATSDAETDAGGTWSPCCVDGRPMSCFCPAGVACNYLPFEVCGDGRCVHPVLGESCPDAGR
ncbi:MAG: hypothetical protein RMK74_09525 [Myxococcales bacterium]|nr:hypothetical protein [Myxococcales bacterium]